jgi:hypothetical protein
MDPNHLNHMANAFAGMIGIFIFIGLIFTAIVIIPIWRILSRIGISGIFSLFLIIPWLGPLILLYVVAFSDWHLIPTQHPYPGLQPYPPPPSYQPPPPTSYNPPPPPQP